MEELKPCPFCGGEAETQKCFEKDYSAWIVGCTKRMCNISMPFFEDEYFTSEENAIKAWNTRAND